MLVMPLHNHEERTLNSALEISDAFGTIDEGMGIVIVTTLAVSMCFLNLIT